MTEISLNHDGRFKLIHNDHQMLFPVSEAGAKALAETLLGIAMNANKLNEKGAPSQFVLDQIIKQWQKDHPTYIEPDFMQEIEL